MYAYIHDAPINRTMYQRVIELIGRDDAPGLVVHLALEQPDGTVRHVDVWESEAACEIFRSTRLGPAVAQMLAEHGITPEGPHAPTAEYAVVDVWLGAGAFTAAGAARPS